MNQATLQSERPRHKSENVYFTDELVIKYSDFTQTADDTAQTFTYTVPAGATTDSILAERCFFKDGELHFGALARLSYDTFNAWVDRGEIINVEGEASFVADSAEALPVKLTPFTPFFEQRITEIAEQLANGEYANLDHYESLIGLLSFYELELTQE